MQSFYALTIGDLQDTIRELGKEKFRAQQLFKWVYEKKQTDPELMSNLSKDFRSQITNLFDFNTPKILKHLISVDGTQKFLFDTGAGTSVESVLIPSDGRMTLCISSEIGCNMACRFCYTGKQKLKRRLKAEEIVGQFLEASRRLADDVRITNIVFMGMGEPLDNSDEVFKAIEILHSPWGINFSRRKITVSTSGLVHEIPKVSAAKVRLAVSLNASNNSVRDQVMPINKKHPIEELLEACREHSRETGDKTTLEYVLLKGVTDQMEHARELVKITRDVPCKINIIPFNEHPGSDYERPSDQQVEKFHAELMRLGAHVLLRRTMGRDIFAACGQLTSQQDNKPETMDISNSRIGGRNGKRSSGGQLSL